MHYVVVGASGALGAEFVEQLAARDDISHVTALSRSDRSFASHKVTSGHIDFMDEASIEKAASYSDHVDGVIVATGMLHDGALMPEKALKELSAENMQAVYMVNTVGPMLIAKHFLPKFSRDSRGVFAVISARVGSVSDNRLGGWHSYRASKAALNMLLKNASIEMKRTHPESIIVGLHPGTVDSDLSKPFQRHVPEGKLFTSEHSVSHMLSVLYGLYAKDSGKLFAYDGTRIEW